MVRTVGSLSPAVYRRRRLVFLAGLVLLVLLLVLTVRAVNSGSDTPARAANSSSSRSSAAAPPASHPSTHAAVPPPASHSAGTSASNGSSVSSSSSASSAPPQPCTASQLKIASVTSARSYAVGAEPVVMLQVTNTGSAPCVQGLGSKDVELRVYNGESRVWGSNDCSPDATPIERTLAVNAPVRVSVIWSGMTSQAHCAGTRQQVGAGTYTLYGLLDGRNGAAAQFAIT